MTRAEAGRLGFEKSKEHLFSHQVRQHEEARSIWESLAKKCPYCKKVIPYERRENRFCGHACAAAFNNRGQVLRKGRTCLFCRKLLIGKQKKYCSRGCFSNQRSQMRKEEIERTGVIGRHGERDCRFSAKKYLKETQGWLCVICGLSEWRGKSAPLILDHIDGNAENWAVMNLRLVCPNCDAQLPTFKARNIGNGRYRRRLRYLQGKSY